MQRNRGRGFTLIELLVVVAIIGLLLSILLPSLTKAREQARIAVCLSNMRSIAQAAAGYLNDNKSLVFAVGRRYRNRNITLWTECIWGGGVPDRKRRDYDSEFVGDLNPIQYRTDVYLIPPEARPLNKYMFPEWSEPTRVLGNQDRVNIPYNPPGVFKCPSDWHAILPNAGDPDNLDPSDAQFPTWQWWGTSYPINWYWPYYYTGRVRGASPDFLRLLRQGAAAMLEREANRGASEFVLFYENALNYPVESAFPRGAPNPAAKIDYLGFHRERNKFTAAFLDGHAAYRKFDTRYPDGPGWTTWLHRPWTDASPDWRPYENN